MLHSNAACPCSNISWTREKGVELGTHCGPWDRPLCISHVVTSGGSCWYQEWYDRDRNQFVYHSV